MNKRRPLSIASWRWLASDATDKHIDIVNRLKPPSHHVGRAA